MRRRQIAPRTDWQARVEAHGLLYHSVVGDDDERGTYWAEGTYYEFSDAEIDTLEAATAELHACCLEAAAHVIEQRRYTELGIPPLAIPLIEASWDAEPPSIYGRMDLAFGPDGVPKLLEYNADTPTSLLEGAVIQWAWREDVLPDRDQFNSIHERLIETWRELLPSLDGPAAHFACVESIEDEMTIGYLRDTAEQAGISTIGILMGDIGWNEAAACFVDGAAAPIRNLFKLYPWEGVLADPFAPMLARAPTLRWIEPAWKLLLSSKGILPVLAQLFPDHPNILPASFTPPATDGWVKKPMQGREGANVTISAPGAACTTDGPYDTTGYIYQRYADLGVHDGKRPVIGSWLVGGEPAGIGIRETSGFVTNNTASFVPHVIA